MIRTAAPHGPIAAGRGSARERLLAAATELFYAEGIHTVGIDRIIERAGVAKASLYNTFGSKDELVRVYLQERHAVTAVRLTAAIARHETPRERLLAVFDYQGERIADPTFRGCAFVNASAETPPGSPIEAASDEYRGWFRSTVVELTRQAGVADPDALAEQLILLYDGAHTAARMDRNRAASTAARAAGEALLDAALAAA